MKKRLKSQILKGIIDSSFPNNQERAWSQAPFDRKSYYKLCRAGRPSEPSSSTEQQFDGEVWYVAVGWALSRRRIRI